MISPFLLTNKKSPDEIQTNQQMISFSINKIKNDEVKLLRERLTVMQRRLKQKQQELNILRQHMETCQNRQLMTVYQQDLECCDDFLSAKDSKIAYKGLQYQRKDVFLNQQRRKNQLLKIYHQIQMNVTSQKSQQNNLNQCKSQQDKFLIHSLQTKLQNYEKKHSIFQQTLNQRTQEFEQQILIIKEKLKDQKRLNSDLMKRNQELEWQNVSLREEIQEACYQQDHLIKPYSQTVIIGVQTDHELTKNPKFTFVRLHNIKIVSNLKPINQSFELSMTRRILNIKIQPSVQYQKSKNRNKLFIFSRQVHQKVLNLQNPHQLLKTSKYNYALNHEIPTENQNFISIPTQEQNDKNSFQNLGHKSRYRSLTNLTGSISTNNLSYQPFYNQNQQELYENLTPLCQIKDFYNKNTIQKNFLYQKPNLFEREWNNDEVSNYIKMIKQQNHSENQKCDTKNMELGKNIKNKTQLSATQNLKRSSLTIRQSLEPEFRSSILRREQSLESSIQLKRVPHSVSVKDLIAQKCRKKLNIK